MNCQNMVLIESLSKRSFFKVQKIRKRSNLAVLLLFCQFPLKRFDNFSLFLV